MFLGEKYLSSPKKIMFIGLDLGSDECVGNNTYHRFATKWKAIKIDSWNDKVYGHHLAGSYMIALYVLKEWILEYKECWDNTISTVSDRQNKWVTNHLGIDNSLPVDVWDRLAFTNLHKFVTIERKKKGGGQDRKWIDEGLEKSLLKQEIALLNPDVIICQGYEGYSFIKNCANDRIVIPTAHPSSCKIPKSEIDKYNPQTVKYSEAKGKRIIESMR